MVRGTLEQVLRLVGWFVSGVPRATPGLRLGTWAYLGFKPMTVAPIA
jgi:hypothetical protein